MSKWNVGIYLRLSSEDGDKDESNSIKNQRKMIQYYIKEQKDMKEYKPYIDDGYTGTDLERPGFKEMLNDIYKGNINCIIIKDTSRLGRNYVKVESFLCDVVRAYNIRLISLNDNIDSYLNPYSLISLEMSFKNLINESYAKDTSNKIKTALNISKKNGNFVGKIAPFGYIKNEDDIHLFEIDPEAAQIVKKIFDLASDGLSRQEIVKTLNEYNIITPSLYFKNQLKYDMSKVTKLWSVQMVDDILKNETYTGKLIQGTRERISHKNHKIVRVPEDEWIIIEHHHKPIIKQKKFDNVKQLLFSKNARVCNNGKYRKYSGYLKCADCGCSMYREKSPKVDYPYYYCGNYRNKKGCTKHYINELELDRLILEVLNKEIDLFCNVEDDIEKVILNSRIEYQADLENIRKEKIAKEIKKYELLLKESLNDYKNGLLSEEDFDSFNDDYLFNLNKLRIEQEELCNNDKLDLEWFNKFKKYKKVESITRDILDSLIEKILIYEDGNIKIIFNFQNEYDELIRYLNSHDFVV